MLKYNKFNLFLLATVFVSGVISGSFLDEVRSVYCRSLPNAEVHTGQYDLINPLLECSEGEVSNKELSGIKGKVEETIERLKENGAITDMAVYFRDLNDGPWFGINEKMEFYPASLMKIPVMMSYLKVAETNPGILDKKLRFVPKKKDLLFLPYVQSHNKLKPGGNYTIRELIYRMITFSDNDAMELLFLYPGAMLKETYSQIHLEFPLNEDYQITVKKYASVFRVIFNASYLDKALSNDALALLTEAEFKRGLPAGVPDNITVAHKFGEKGIEKGGQFHDCGIIYYPKNPYVLCVMTRGKDPEALISSISVVSKTVFEEVDRQMNEQVSE